MAMPVPVGGVTIDVRKLSEGRGGESALSAARAQPLMRAQRLEAARKDAERTLYESRADVHAVVALYRDLHTIRWAAEEPEHIKAFEDAIRATIGEAAARAREYTEAVADYDAALADATKARAEAAAAVLDADEGRNGTT